VTEIPNPPATQPPGNQCAVKVCSMCGKVWQGVASGNMRNLEELPVVCEISPVRGVVISRLCTRSCWGNIVEYHHFTSTAWTGNGAGGWKREE